MARAAVIGDLGGGAHVVRRLIGIDIERRFLPRLLLKLDIERVAHIGEFARVLFAPGLEPLATLERVESPRRDPWRGMASDRRAFRTHGFHPTQTLYRKAESLERRTKHMIPREFARGAANLDEFCGEENFEKARISIDWMNTCLKNFTKDYKLGFCSRNKNYFCAVYPQSEGCLQGQ